MSQIEKVIEVIRYGNIGERITSLLIAKTIDMDRNIVSASLYYLVKKCQGEFIRPMARLHRETRHGKAIVVYEIVDPNYPVEVTRNQNNKRIVINRAPPSYQTLCTLPFIESIDQVINR